MGDISCPRGVADCPCRSRDLPAEEVIAECPFCDELVRFIRTDDGCIQIAHQDAACSGIQRAGSLDALARAFRAAALDAAPPRVRVPARRVAR